MPVATNLLMTFKNYSDDSTLVCPNESATMPASELQKMVLTDKWRTQNVTDGLNWIQGDLPEGEIPGLFALIRHNLSQVSDWRVSLCRAANMTIYGDFTTPGNYSIATLEGSASVTGGQLVATNFDGTVTQASDETYWFGAGEDLPLGFIAKITVTGFSSNGGKIRISMVDDDTPSESFSAFEITGNGTFLLYIPNTTSTPYRWKLYFNGGPGGGPSDMVTATVDNLEIYGVYHISSATPDEAYPPLQVFGSLPNGLYTEDGSVPEADRKKMRIMSYHYIAASDIEPVPSGGGLFFIELFDSTNSDGYLEAGRLIVSNYLQFERNPDRGSLGMKNTDKSMISMSDGGQPYIIEKESYRTIKYRFSNISEAQSIGAQLGFIQVKGQRKDFLVIPDPSNRDLQQIWNIYGLSIKAVETKRSNETGSGAVGDRAGLYDLDFEVQEIL